MKKLKKTLRRAEALKKPSYDRTIIVTVDTSSTGIGWVINQADSDGSRYPIRFGAKVLNERQMIKEGEPRSEGRRGKSKSSSWKTGLIWRAPKRSDGIPLRVVGTKEQRNWIMSEFHEPIGLDTEEHGQHL